MTFESRYEKAEGLSSSAEDRIKVDLFVRREAGSVLDYFHRRCPSAEDAADLLGDTLVVVWRRRADIPSDPTQARMWLFGVARKVLNGNRRSRRRSSALTTRLGDLLTTVAETPHDDEGAQIRRWITTLSKLDQEIVTLVYWEGFTLEETAQILDAKPGTIRSRHSRARARLRSMALEAGVFA